METISVRALAQRWGCSTEAVRRLCREGRIPAMRPLGRWIIRLEDVEVFEARERARYQAGPVKGRPVKLIGGGS